MIAALLITYLEGKQNSQKRLESALRNLRDEQNFDPPAAQLLQPSLANRVAGEGILEEASFTVVISSYVSPLQD